jgi:sarcosine oxidase, subunit alpha
VAIIGGGPAGLKSAIELATKGEQVTLIDDQPGLGGHLRFSKNADNSLAELIAQIQKHANLQVLEGCYCFGLYEGNLLGIVQPRPNPQGCRAT